MYIDMRKSLKYLCFGIILIHYIDAIIYIHEMQFKFSLLDSFGNVMNNVDLLETYL